MDSGNLFTAAASATDLNNCPHSELTLPCFQLSMLYTSPHHIYNTQGSQGRGSGPAHHCHASLQHATWRLECVPALEPGP